MVPLSIRQVRLKSTLIMLCSLRMGLLGEFVDEHLRHEEVTRLVQDRGPLRV
jgi:hypothetical protein